MSEDVMTLIEDGASVIFCSNFDAPKTLSTSISISCSMLKSVMAGFDVDADV